MPTRRESGHVLRRSHRLRRVLSALHALLLVLAAARVCAESAEGPNTTGGDRPLAPASVTVPPGMAYVPEGSTHIGSNGGLPSEQPVFVANVDAFLLDVHPVTVAEFGTFVKATGFVSQAERDGNAAVFDLKERRWALVDGASWRRPLGSDGAAAEADHPVTQVTWNDAVAYCSWADKRLPNEVEWEHAARGARDDRGPYPWGSAPVDGERFRANVWQGRFPDHNTLEDGYLYTSPVGAFGADRLGLVDMAGNVWEWTDDWFRPYTDRGQPYTPSPTSEKVQRGGSFLCEPSWCHGYRVSARSHSTPDSALFHVGFRCAKSLPK